MKIGYDIEVKHLDCAGDSTVTLLVLDANNPGHAARLAFRRLIKMRYIDNQPLSSNTGGWQGVTITQRTRNIVKLAFPAATSKRKGNQRNKPSRHVGWNIAA